MAQKGDLEYNIATDTYAEFDGTNWIVLTWQEAESAKLRQRSLQNGIPRPSSQGLYGYPSPSGGGFASAIAAQQFAAQNAAHLGRYQQYVAGQLASLPSSNQSFIQLAGHQLLLQQPALQTQKVPREGLRVGELTAYRAWQLTENGHLKSMSAAAIWAPGEAMTSSRSDMKGDMGIHCFKLMRDALAYGGDIWGEILIWGEVIEHELGYRAEYARIISLQQSVHKHKLYPAICKMYGVPAQ